MSKQWDSLEDKAFGFVKIPPRTAKPREHGLTVMADKRLGPRMMEDVFELAGDYVDWVKFGISAPRIHSRETLKKKIDICHANDVKAFIAGDVFEMAIMQGVFERFLDEAKDLGADGIEVATAQIWMDMREKVLLVEKAAKAGLKVFGEVGKKGLGWWSVPPSYISKEINALKEAGAYKLIIQGEGVLEGVDEINEKPLFEIAARHDIRDIIFQAKNGDAQTWMIQNFGPEVNMDVESEQVVVVELCRRGIRKRGLFNLMASVKE